MASARRPTVSPVAEVIPENPSLDQLLDSPLASHVLATVHTSSILRGPAEDRQDAMAGLIADLRVAAGVL